MSSLGGGNVATEFSVNIYYEGEEVEIRDCSTRWYRDRVIVYGPEFEIQGTLEDIAYLGEAITQATGDIAKERAIKRAEKRAWAEARKAQVEDENNET